MIKAFKGFKECIVGRRRFYFHPEIDALKANEILAALDEEFITLDAQKERRTVHLLPKAKAVHKLNIISRFRDRVYIQFGLQSKRGKYSLIDEAKNLIALNSSGITPRFYAFSSSGIPVSKQILIMEFFENAITLDEYFKGCVHEQKVMMLKKVFLLFSSAAKEKFSHMDPNPGNIIIVNNELKFIDFECCFLGDVEPEFYYGFSFGYLFHYWLYKYFEEGEYDNCVLECLPAVCNGNEFYKYYERFKSKKLSRSKRFKCFFEPGRRKQMLFAE